MYVHTYVVHTLPCMYCVHTTHLCCMYDHVREGCGLWA